MSVSRKDTPHTPPYSWLPQLCSQQWRWREDGSRLEALGLLQGWGAASQVGPGVGQPRALQMLAEDSSNDRPGNLS